MLVQIAFSLAGNILILRGFLRAIPAELQDAAYIDGCSDFDFFCASCCRWPDRRWRPSRR